MTDFRDFSAQERPAQGHRQVENAPAPMRQELTGAVFQIAEDRADIFGHFQRIDITRMYLDIEQALGVEAAGNPANGFQQRIGRDLAQAPWERVYDIAQALSQRFMAAGKFPQYQLSINRIFAAHDVAWELGNDGVLHRVLPNVAALPIASAFAELQNPAYAAALALAIAARAAYDTRPRDNRNACVNAYAAMEAVAKIRFGMPNATLGDVITAARNQQRVNAHILGVVQRIEVLRHNNFGHGMVAEFALTPAEVDFTYLSCIAGCMLFIRL